MSTAIWTVKEALEARLKADEALIGTAILRGKPDPLPAKCLLLWDTTAKREHAQAMGPQKLNEFIDQQIVIDVAIGSGQDFTAPEEEARAIFEALEAVVRADLTLGGIWMFDRISEVKQNYFRQDKRRGCRVFVTLTGKAQI